MMGSLHGCTISRNMGAYGAGLFALGARLHITDSTLSSNVAAEGGAIRVDSSVLSNNYAEAYGGGLLRARSRAPGRAAAARCDVDQRWSIMTTWHALPESTKRCHTVWLNRARAR